MRDRGLPPQKQAECDTALAEFRGITKRELFAAMIAQGMHAATPGCISETVVPFAVKEADALIAALKG